MRLSLLLICIALCALATSAQARDLWSADEFKNLCASLDPVSPATLTEALGRYKGILLQTEGLGSRELRYLPNATLDALLAAAAQARWSVLEVFSQSAFAAPDGCALYMGRDTLAEVNKRYDLHGVWQLAATEADDQARTLAMDYMIVGLGHLIVGYPRAATIAIEDGEAVSGHYDYAPYFSARIVNSPAERGVVDIRALTEPDGEFGSFIGPYGSRIHKLTLKDGAIRVLFTLGLEQEKRTQNVAVSLRRLMALTP